MATQGRPSAMQAKPVIMPAVFDDPARAVDLIRQGAPYRTLPEFYGSPGGGDDYGASAMFRESLTDPFFLENPNWIAAARASFGADVIEPLRCLLNVYAPMDELKVHHDMPTFRGFTPTAETRHLFMAMMKSGLFYDWMVQFASGLVWFYRGEGGEFLYWEHGAGAPPKVVRPPFWNMGVMSDNEAMFHAVAPTGSASQRERFAALLRRSDRLHHLTGEQWEIRDDERLAARMDQSQLRMSLLWKARVFRDESHRGSFADDRLDLTPERIAEVFLRDLAMRGVKVAEPSDPLDGEWQAYLAEAYPQAFQVRAADFLG